MNNYTLTYKGSPAISLISDEVLSGEHFQLPSGACYAYVFRGEGQDLAFPFEIRALDDHVIASLCGITLGRLMQAYSQPGKIESICVHFSTNLLKDIFKGGTPEAWKDITEPVHKYLAQEKSNASVKEYFFSIKSMFANGAKPSDEEMQEIIKELLELLLLSTSSEYLMSILRSLFSTRVFSFKEIVEAHMYEPLGLEALASITNTSLATFKRKFRDIYNESPAKWLHVQRLEKLALLLQYRQDPIHVLGYECGFSSPEHLSRSFKKHFSLTPTEYRMKLNN